MSTTFSIRPRSTQRASRSSLALSDDASDDESAEAPVPNCAQRFIASLSSRQVSEQLNAIAQVHLSPQVFTQSVTQPFTEAFRADSLSQLLAQPVSEDRIARQYTAMCLSLWKLAQQLAQAGFYADSSIDDATRAFSKVSFLQQQVTQRLHRLCFLWAVGKWQRPTHPFFVPSSTDFAALQAKWKHPAIQASLLQATTHLLHSPQEHWITAHIDCWAYLLGHAIHQLLQWNHQLTPQYLRELLQVNEVHD